MTTAFAMQVLINFTFYYFLYLEKEILFQYGDVSKTQSSKVRNQYSLILNRLTATLNTLLPELNV